MQVINKIFIFSIVSLLHSNVSEDILYGVLNRLEKIDHEYQVHYEEKTKNKPIKTRVFSTAVHWPSSGDISKKVYLKMLKPQKMQEVQYWEHHFKQTIKINKWMTMPVTGDLKDISNKNKKGSSFDLSDIEITEELILTHDSEIVDQKSIKNDSLIVIKCTKKNTDSELEHKMLWVNKKHLFVHKAEFYNNSGKLYKEIECIDLHKNQAIVFPKEILIKDHKKKKEINIIISNVKFDYSFNLNIFKPKPFTKNDN